MRIVTAATAITTTQCSTALLAGPRLALLQLDDCLYLIHRDALQSRLEQLSSRDCNPAYVCVSHLDSISCLAMASDHDITVRHDVPAAYCPSSYPASVLSQKPAALMHC